MKRPLTPSQIEASKKKDLIDLKRVSDQRWENTYHNFQLGEATLHDLIFSMGECNRVDGLLWKLYGSCIKVIS